jgi:pilus assembly protein FimV
LVFKIEVHVISKPSQMPDQPTVFLRQQPHFGGFNRLHAVAAAVVISIGLAHTGDALALALGRIVVQSALGEPLRAEIEIPEITPEEASGLRVGLATPAAFAAAGMQFNQALGAAQLTLERRPDGRVYLQLSSPRPVNEPFVDLIVEANWASGRIVRDYTLLIDPPKSRSAAPITPLAAAAVALPVRPLAATSAQTLPPAATPSTRTQADPRAAIQAPVAPSVFARPTQVRVRAGDSAGRIAQANRPVNVSLDQMLVAMLRANPSAFIGDNVNRIKAGAVIDLPNAAAASAIAAVEARLIVAAQSQDFDDFRSRLAGRIPTNAVAAGSRAAAGRVQAEVQEQNLAAPTQDTLSLSKGALPGATNVEDKLAQERQAKETSDRMAELTRNVAELAELNSPSATQAAEGSAAVAEGAAPASAVIAPLAVLESTEASPATQAATEPTVANPNPQAVAPEPTAMAEDPSMLDQLQKNPLVLPAAGGLLALLAGFAFYRLRQRKQGASVDSSFLESRAQHDSFFGASGGQRIDTTEATASSSSMVYSASQLDAAGDVDPVAEADVYLAYGRDLQAEEILKEAMRGAPMRVAIHNKLLEIYAKRRDAKAFEVVATEVYRITGGQGVEWDRSCELGRELDPNNLLYQPGETVVALSAASGTSTQIFGNSSIPNDGDAPATHVGLDLDLDLDFLPNDTPVSLAQAFAAGSETPTSDDLGRVDVAKQTPPLDLTAVESRSTDFELDFSSPPDSLQNKPLSEPMSNLPVSDLPTFDLSNSLPGLNFDDPEDAADLAASAPSEPQPSVSEIGSEDLISFDMSDADFNLDISAFGAADDQGLSAENSLDTKLALAEEFRAIGDLEGARSLAEEVLAEASGTRKSKASDFLADLG